MGVVYEAYDNERRASVALKALTNFDADALVRFKREFRALQGLAHPNLVALDELFVEDGQWFFSMELLDGVDFVSHVRGTAPKVAYESTVRESVGTLAARRAAGADDDAATFDEPKLRDGLRQLLLGLAALHAVDKVHRDIKPSNVFVTREGRVVILDFGLVTGEVGDERATGQTVLGTPAYMAPEQAASRTVGTAGDLYAVGVMLYEALTGRIPFEGMPLQMLIEKQTREPASPSSLAPGVPKDLDTLCAKLLRFDPARRPSAASVLRSLPVSLAAAQAGDFRPISTDAPTFVGRTAELAELRVAYDRAGQELATVLVCGESGIGKSQMVRRFVASLAAEDPDAMLLEGRCYEREAVPYKTLDGIADALSRRLSLMSDAEVAALLPVRSAMLAQVFPVMLRVPRIAKEHAAHVITLQPHELRHRAFFALRDLLMRVATRRRTVLVIDDLQWADDDGLRALAQILRPPDPPPLLLIGTVRLTPGNRDAQLQRVRDALSGDVRVMELANLGHDEARELAVALLRRMDNPGADPEAIARETRGHPLFVEELARQASLGGAAREAVKLDDAIWSRVAQLDGPTRAMAELVAVAGKPVPQEVVAAAARFEPVEFTRRAAVLRASNIVRTSGTHWADAIEPYHDRVREAVLAQLEPERRRALHEALAIAFEASSHGDAETRATHWREAGNASRAAHYAVLAGDQAAKAFAFDRAAQWYEQALELLPQGSTEVRVKLAHVFANAGRGALAAPHFEAAAAESPPLAALELRRRAADQLLRAGLFDRGIVASRAVVSALGMRMPTSRFATLGSYLFFHLYLRFRGLRFREREAARITAPELARVDACFSVGAALLFADTVSGFLFLTRALLLALSVGELERVARSVGMLVIESASGGGKTWARTEALTAAARDLSVRSGSVASRAWVDVASGFAHYMVGRFREGIDAMDRGLEMTADGWTGLDAYERVSTQTHLLSALALAGRFREFRERQEGALRDAQGRNDVYAQVILRVGLANLVWLLDDRADLAERHAREALEAWSKSGFHVMHYYGLVALVTVKLYAGDADEAYALASDLQRKASASLIWRVQIIRLRTVYTMGLAALAMLAQSRGDRDALLRQVSTAAHALDREKMPWCGPFASVLRAAIACHAGARDDALTALDAAARAFDEHDMRAYAAATRHRAANLRADATAAGEIATAFAVLQSEGVVAPEAFLAVLVPAFAPAPTQAAR
jgi:tetratricopeptide (TPR) repeat protein